MGDPRQPGHGDDRVETSGIEFVWSASERIARMEFLRPDSFGTGNDARILISALQRWSGDDERPFAMLVDASRTSSVDAEFRAAFFEFFDSERERGRAAWFDARPHIQAIVTMFITAMQSRGPFHGRMFDTEDEARAWLRSEGVDG